MIQSLASVQIVITLAQCALILLLIAYNAKNLSFCLEIHASNVDQGADSVLQALLVKNVMIHLRALTVGAAMESFK